MKKRILNILIFSSILTTLGFIMDGDPKEPSMLLRFVEFFGMLAIVFLFTTSIYFSLSFITKQLRRS